MNLTVRQCMADDAHTLRNFSYQTFQEAFASMNAPSSMNAYLERAFNLNKLRGELSNSDSSFHFLYAGGELAGYIKLNESPSQTDINDTKSLEIERIYVAKEFQGRGLGNALMNEAVELAQKRNKLYIWLGVWEKNERAVLFYKKNGFYKVGTHSFFMGEEEQTDFIMRKDL